MTTRADSPMRKLAPALVSLLLILALATLAFKTWRKADPKNAPQPRPIAIGYQEIALYRHIFTAYSKGYFTEENLTVKLQPVPSANVMMQGLIAGDLDVLGLTNLQVALTVEGKEPGHFKLAHILVWGTQSFPDYILSRNGSGITHIKDLEGHTMARHPGSAVKAFAEVSLRRLGVNPDRINFIELEPDKMQSAVIAKTVDSVYCMDPVATNLVRTGSSKVLISNPMRYVFEPPTPISAVALSSQFVKARPQEAQRLIRAINRSVRYLRDSKHEEEVAQHISAFTPIDPQTALAMNPSEYWLPEEVDVARVQALADRFYELRIVPSHIDVRDILLPDQQRD